MSQVYAIRIEIKSADAKTTFYTNHAEDVPPLDIEIGKSQIFPKVEEALKSMSPGEQRSVELKPEDAFGFPTDEAIQQVPLKEIPEELRQVGAELSFQTADNQIIPGKLHQIEGETALVDFNHPLAGQPVVLDVILVEIK